MIDQAIKLTADQQQAEDAILNFLASDEHIFLLQGYAGTGKTTLLKSIITYLKEDIALLAPTNKAVKVLRDKVPFQPNITMSTIDRFFLSKREYTRDGNVEYTPTGISNEDVSVIFIDECSMIDSRKYKYILEFIKKFDLQVIFIGDGCQINPVNEKLSPSFRFARHFSSATLHEIKRQSNDSYIIPLSKSIRDRINKQFNFDGMSKSGVRFLDAANGRQNLEIINSYFLSREYIKDPDHCKILGWTNSLVNASNDRIRQEIFGVNCNFIEEQETLVANSPVQYYISTEPDRTYYVPTNDNFYVSSFKQSSRAFSSEEILSNFPTYLANKLPSMETWSVNIQYYHTNIIYNGRKGWTQVLMPDSAQEYEKVTSFARGIANVLKKNREISSYDVKTAWALYYRYLNLFADFKYNHAITVHKSQGSTYKNVFVYAFDIMRNSRIPERNRILYTAVTRAAENLFIIQ